MYSIYPYIIYNTTHAPNPHFYKQQNKNSTETQNPALVTACQPPRTLQHNVLHADQLWTPIPFLERVGSNPVHCSTPGH